MKKRGVSDLNFKILKYVSIKYYQYHISNVLCIIIPLIICVCSLYCTFQFKISYEIYQYNEVLKNYGSYDFLLYDLSDADYRNLCSSPCISDVGILKRIGTIASDDEDIVSFGYADDKAFELMSVTLSEGRFPERDNEILTTKDFLLRSGIIPQKDVNINLNMADDSSNGKTAEFQVVGLFENYNFVDGNKNLKYTYRDDDNNSAETAYPEVYVSEDFYNQYSKDTKFDVFDSAVIFNVKITDEKDDFDFYSEIINNEGELNFLSKYLNEHSKCCHKSRIINDSVLRFKPDDIKSANTMGYNHVKKRIINGTIKKDFFSLIILPILSSAIILIAVCSALSSMKTSIYERKERFKTLSILGMSKKQMMLCLFTELGVWSVFGIILGTVFGIAVYRTVVSLSGHTIPLSENADQFIHAITLSPYPFIFVFLVSYILLGFVFIFNSTCSTKKEKIKTKKYFIKGKITAILSLRRLNNISGNSSAFSKIIIVSLSFSVVLSYVYINECFNGNTSYKNAEYPMGNYYAERNYYDCRTDDYFENHHESGIPADSIADILKTDCVNSIYASVINCSTKLCYKSDNIISGKLNKHINENIQKGRYTSDNPDYNSDAEILTELGYDTDDELFCTPTIGLTDEYLSVLNQYVVDGKINIDKVKSGQEVLLLQQPLKEEDPLYEEYKKAGIPFPYSSFDLSEIYSVGDILPITDIVYDADVDINDEININSGEYFKKGRNGKRHDIFAKIGAIVKISDENLRTLITYSGCDGKTPLFNILCSNDSFINWGLPDKNISRLYIDALPGKDIKKFDFIWSKMAASSSKITADSLGDILEDIKEQQNLKKCIFAVCFFVLFVNGILGILSSVAYDCKIHHNKLTQLYYMGINKRFIYIYESFFLFVIIILSQIIVTTLFAIIQLIIDKLKSTMNDYLYSHADLKGNLLYIRELIPMNVKWFGFKQLFTPIVILCGLLLLSIILTTIYQFRNIKVRRKKNGKSQEYM